MMRRLGPWRTLALACTASMLGACSSVPHLPVLPLPFPSWPSVKHPKIDPGAAKLPNAGSGRGGYYQDDGPGDNPPANLHDLADAVVRAEPYSRFGNRPYAVFGKTYVPLLGNDPFVQRGTASWYGKKFHGQRTSSGELYDMYQMTAAHPTLPIPSFARVTSLDTGKQVVVRVNDRGPFHATRIIDVSYTAALKLGLLGKGSGQVEVERLLPDDPARLATRRRNAPLLPDVLTVAVPVMAENVAQAMTMPVPSNAPSYPAPNFSSNIRSNVSSTTSLNEAANLPPTGVAGTMSVTSISLTPAPVALAAQATQATQATGYYVQLGAFSQGDKAAGMRDRVEQNVGLGVAGMGLGAALEVVQAGPWHRLFCGPFASRAEALQALKSVPAALGLKPLIVRRE